MSKRKIRLKSKKTNRKKATARVANRLGSTSKNPVSAAKSRKRPSKSGSKAKQPGLAKPRAGQKEVSTDIRRAYLKSLLGDYLGRH